MVSHGFQVVQEFVHPQYAVTPLVDSPFGAWGMVNLEASTNGHGSKHWFSPSEHLNPSTKIGSEMGGEFTYPKMGSHWI